LVEMKIWKPPLFGKCYDNMNDWTKLKVANKIEPYEIDAYIWLLKLHLNTIKWCNVYYYLTKIKINTHGCWEVGFR
jgi:hypothetical protein